MWLPIPTTFAHALSYFPRCFPHFTSLLTEQCAVCCMLDPHQSFFWSTVYAKSWKIKLLIRFLFSKLQFFQTAVWNKDALWSKLSRTKISFLDKLLWTCWRILDCQSWKVSPHPLTLQRKLTLCRPACLFFYAHFSSLCVCVCICARVCWVF